MGNTNVLKEMAIVLICFFILLPLTVFGYLFMVLIIKPLDDRKVSQHKRRYPTHRVYPTYHGRECRDCDFWVSTNDFVA